MISCSECIESLKPDDPRVPVGKYHYSSCDYFCDKPSYYRELEQMNETLEPEEPKIVKHINIDYKSDMSKKDYDLLQQTARKTGYLEKLIIDISKKREQQEVSF